MTVLHALKIMLMCVKRVKPIR